MKLFGLVLVLALLGCGGVESAPRCEAGRVQSCPCAGGATGTQECGPLGAAWSACACGGGDAGADVAVTDGAADAAGDASLVDGAPAPRLYRACDLGGDCGAGLTCVAVPGLVRDAGAGRGVCTTSCLASTECAAGALCVMGACVINCVPTTAVCASWGTSCSLSTTMTSETMALPTGTYTAFCAP